MFSKYIRHISKMVFGIGTAGMVGVPVAGMGIYKLASSNRSMPRCRVFFSRGETNSETFEETTLEVLKSKKYTNESNFLDDVQTACNSTNVTEKPHYRGRVYVTEETEETEGQGVKGVYSKDKQKTLGMRHDDTIDK